MELELLTKPFLDETLLFDVSDNNTESANGSQTKAERALKQGVSAANWYLRNNFLGPPKSSKSVSEQKDSDDHRLVEAAVDTHLLNVALNCFEKVSDYGNFVSVFWWVIRVNWLKQRSLYEPSVECRQAIFEANDKFEATQFFQTLPPDLKTEYLVELSTILLFYYEYEKSQKYLTDAAENQQLHVSLLNHSFKLISYVIVL